MLDIQWVHGGWDAEGEAQAIVDGGMRFLTLVVQTGGPVLRRTPSRKAGTPRWLHASRNVLGGGVSVRVVWAGVRQERSERRRWRQEVP